MARGFGAKESTGKFTYNEQYRKKIEEEKQARAERIKIAREKNEAAQKEYVEKELPKRVEFATEKLGLKVDKWTPINLKDYIGAKGSELLGSKEAKDFIENDANFRPQYVMFTNGGSFAVDSDNVRKPGQWLNAETIINNKDVSPMTALAEEVYRHCYREWSAGKEYERYSNRRFQGD